MNKKETPNPDDMWKPHPNWGDAENKVIMESELAGGVWIEKLEVGKKLRMVTKNRTYIIEKRKDGIYMKGHPKFCPEFTKVSIHGSTWGGSMLKMNFLGNGMFLEFSVPGHPEWRQITTSQIQEVTELSKEEENIFDEYEKEMKDFRTKEEQK